MCIRDRYKACKTPQSAQRQREVVECLVDMMRTQQYGDITVCALCQRAQMPRKAFYRYFETKDDVFEALVELTMLEYCLLYTSKTIYFIS